jgi:putative ATPase
MAFNDALFEVQQQGDLQVPLPIRNAPTQLIKKLNYGKDY